MTRRAIENAPAIKKIICDRIAEGETMVAICLESDMPSREAIRKWLSKDSEFQENYTRAQCIRQMGWSEEIIHIADGIPERATSQQIARARQQINARKWATARVVGGMRSEGTGNPSETTKKQRRLALANQLQTALDKGLDLKGVIEELQRD